MLAKLDPDNWNFSLLYKLQVGFVLMHLITIYWAFTQFSVPVLLWSLLFWTLYQKVGREVGFHRYFTHNSFKMPRWKARILLFLACMLGNGSSINYALAHSAHHEHADTDRDSQSVEYAGFWRTYMFLGRINRFDGEYALLRRLMKDPDQVFVKRHYFKIFYGYFLLLCLASWIEGSMAIVVGVLALPVVLSYHERGLVAWLNHSHTFGYQNFTGEKEGTSKNNMIIWLFLGAGILHNNHHHRPGAYRTDFTDKWYEYDIWGWFIETFLMSKEEREAARLREEKYRRRVARLNRMEIESIND